MEFIDCPPVLVVGFNRPDYLIQVFDAVRQARPKELFLALDAPREGRNDLPGYEASKKIFQSVDWPCNIHYNYADKNMGCRVRMTSAISWALDHVDRIVIFEDDVVPDLTFFRYCSELLERYKDDQRIGMIAGHDEHLHLKKIDTYGDSYYFDRIASITGWATWRRAWRLHDVDMAYWPDVRKRFSLFNEIIKNRLYLKHLLSYNDKLFEHRVGAWAGMWLITMQKENMLCVHPFVNLTSHIGVESAREGDLLSAFNNRKRQAMEFPLKHPNVMLPRGDCEKYYYHDLWGINYTVKDFAWYLVTGAKNFAKNRILRALLRAIKR